MTTPAHPSNTVNPDVSVSNITRSAADIAKIAFPRGRAKIIATIGPACRDETTIRALLDAGVSVFRLNFSHGSHEDHREAVRLIRAEEHRRGDPVAILMDLQGPKLRIGTFRDGPVMLEPGQSFSLSAAPDTEGTADGVGFPHAAILEVLEPGMPLLVDDGKIRLRVTATRPGAVETEVETGGPLSNRKGVNIPSAMLPVAAMTAKDRTDLEAGLEMGVDWVALSFVQRPEDLTEARQLIDGRAALLAKLEKPAAIQHLDAILDQCDAAMVARGDLGVELPPEHVPALQKRIVRECRNRGLPVVIATQMLESMIQAPTPTRAEASDVATAIYDGADAVMLSAETAAGAYPVEAVAVMSRIIQATEADALYRERMDVTGPDDAMQSDNAAISHAACTVARARDCAAIVTFTSTGSTAMRASRLRGPVPLLALTPSRAVARRLRIAWGVRSVVTQDISSFGEMVASASTVVSELGMAAPGDAIVITAGVPFGSPGTTNILRLTRIRSEPG
ncbi:MAG: pyruvate kinase [Xanthobacter sp.]